METIKNWTLVQWISFMVGLNTLLIGATPQLTVLFGAAAIPYIGAVAVLGNGVLSIFGMVSGGQSNQVLNVLAMKGVEHIDINEKANKTLAAIAVDPTVDKIAPLPAAQAAVAKTASSA